jgi:hypothetical protein
MTVLPRVFDRMEQALAAREALLAAGFAPEQLELTSRHDEAGPAEGNFLVGNVKHDTVERTEFSQTQGGEGDNTYLHNYATTVERGVFLLTVAAADDAESARAAEIVSHHGGSDPNELLTAPAGP